MPDLVLGPLLRWVGETEATVWVETSGPCEVEVLGARERSFCVEGHHYALLIIGGLEPGRAHPYEVRLDGEVRWPRPGSEFPPSVIRTPAPGTRLDVAFGSCRVALPHEPPYTLSPDEDERGKEWDALYALALRMRDEPHDRWPDVLLMLGDQVYVDEGSPAVRERIAVVDSRAGRVLEDTRHVHHEHQRAMIDDREWEWLERQCTGGDFDHLLIASSLPILVEPGLHALEAFSEAICDGAWGSRVADWGEKLRRAMDLEHWAAFEDSFHRMARLLEDVAAGRRGDPPATICLLGGDVHHAFLAEVGFRRGAGARTRVVQAVCSPFRNDLDRHERQIMRFAASR